MSEETYIPPDYDLREILSAMLHALIEKPLTRSEVKQIIQKGKPKRN
jgi:hypothetical protein